MTKVITPTTTATTVTDDEPCFPCLIFDFGSALLDNESAVSDDNVDVNESESVGLLLEIGDFAVTQPQFEP